MGSFRPAAGGGAAKILRKATTVQNGADRRFVHLKRGRKRRDIRCQIDNRPGVQAAIQPAIQTPANARRERVVHRRVAEGAWDAHGFKRPVPPGTGSKKPVTSATGLSLSSARARKKRNRARFGNYRRVSPNANGRDPGARTDTHSQWNSAHWVGRRCCAAGYDGRASAFALLQRDKTARPYRLGSMMAARQRGPTVWEMV